MPAEVDSLRSMIRDLLTKVEALTVASVRSNTCKLREDPSVTVSHDRFISVTPVFNRFDLLSRSDDVEETLPADDRSTYIAPNQETWRNMQKRRLKKEKLETSVCQQ